MLLCLTLLLGAAGEKERLDAGDEAPNFAAKTLNADASKVRVFTLDGVVGAEATDKKKAVLVSFIQGACEQCKKELSFLQALQAEYRDKGLLVVSVSIDKDEAEIKRVSDAATAAKIDFPIVNDRFNIVANRYFAKKAPQLHVIDETGKITKSAVAYDESVNGDVLSEVRKTLGLPVSDPTPPTLAGFMRAPRTTETAVATPVAAVTEEPAAAPAKGKKGAKKPKPEKKPKTAKAAADKGPKRIGRPK